MVHSLLGNLNHIFFANIYLSLFILILVEEMGIPLPIPGDFYIVLAGTQIALGRASFLPVLFVVLLGTIIGSSLLYAVTYFGGHSLVMKYGKYILISHAKLETAQRYFQRHGSITILVGRLIWGLRIVSTVVGGIFQLRYDKFIIATALSTIIWVSIYTRIGMYFGKDYKQILAKFDIIPGHLFSYVILLYFVIIIIGIWYFLIHKRKGVRNESE